MLRKLDLISEENLRQSVQRKESARKSLSALGKIPLGGGRRCQRAFDRGMEFVNSESLFPKLFDVRSFKAKARRKALLRDKSHQKFLLSEK